MFFFYLEKIGLWNNMQLARKAPWAIGLTMITTAAFYTPGSLSSQLGGLAMGLFLGLRLGKTERLHEKIAINNRGKFSLAGLGIAGLIAFDSASKTLVSHQADSIIAMLLYFGSYFLIGLWLTTGTYLPLYFRDKIKSSQKPDGID
jgi:hypothetical protein